MAEHRRFKKNIPSKRKAIVKILDDQQISPQLKSSFMGAYDAWRKRNQALMT